MPIQSVSSKKLYVQIAEQLTQLIREGEFMPGQQIPSERDLAQQLGVSRPTVREAIIALEIAGAIEVRVGVGAFVTSAAVTLPTGADHSPLEVLAARLIIEPDVAGLAAEHRTEQEFLALKRVVKQMEVQTRNGVWSQSTDRAFHLMIADACGNQPLREIVTGLWREREEALSGKYHEHLASVSSLRADTLSGHQAIVAAIQEADPEAARTAMREHLTTVQQQMLAVWETT